MTDPLPVTRPPIPDISRTEVGWPRQNETRHMVLIGMFGSQGITILAVLGLVAGVWVMLTVRSSRPKDH
jgi:hypothetical protein